MKLSFILELFLVFLVMSFAASRTVQRQPKLILATELNRQNDDENLIINDVSTLTETPIIDDDEDVIEEESSGAEETNVATVQETITNLATDDQVNTDDRPPINKYCSCSNAVCNCCRDFSLPIVPVRGPGCAEIKYLKNDRLSVTVKYGDFVLANRIVKAGTSKPICIPLPGGFSRFCGRIYGVQRVNEDFKACLGLELRADEEVEAALKVSCFKFGERGLAVTEADPLPAIESETGSNDDDDDDLFGLGGGGDDDDGDDDDDDDNDDDDESDDLFGLGSSDDDEEDNESGTSDDSPDYTGFSLISDGFDGIFGDDDSGLKKKKVVTIKTKNNNASIEAVKNTTIVDENKNDKDSIHAIVAVNKPITDATVDVTPTVSKKKQPSGGIFDAFLGDDDDDEDEDEKDDDDDEDEDDDDEDDDKDKDEADENNTEKIEETDDTNSNEINKDETEDDKEENEDDTENIGDDENDDDEEEEEEEEDGVDKDNDDLASNGTDALQKVKSTVKNTKKQKDDYYGYLSRLMKIF